MGNAQALIKKCSRGFQYIWQLSRLQDFVFPLTDLSKNLGHVTNNVIAAHDLELQFWWR